MHVGPASDAETGPDGKGDQRLSDFHDHGPGRSTRCERLREFQDQRPNFNVHDDSPPLVKLKRSGPNLNDLRKISPNVPPSIG